MKTKKDEEIEATYKDKACWSVNPLLHTVLNFKHVISAKIEK